MRGSIKARLVLFPALVTLMAFTGCASLKRDKGAAAETPEVTAKAEKPDGAEKGSTDEDAPKTASGTKSSADIENQTIDEIIRIEEPNTQNLYDNSRYDFPITMNSRVEGWIDYFTGKGREHMERYLARSSRYIPSMKEALKKAGIPQDIVYLALIESGFNLRAKSRARAVGAWQFMKATGKRYGLRVDAWIDERRDPIRSTEAAAKYLKDLYLMFESWYLAASAYNAGEYKILRAIEELKTNNYWRICETRLLRRETKDYVPKLIAAAIIAKNPTRYGFESVSYQDELAFDKVVVDFPVRLRDIAKLVDAPEEDIEDLNPELVRGMVPPGVGNYEVRVPVGSRVIVERAIAGLRSQVQVADSEMPRQHVVQAGETLGSLSRRYRVSVKQLANTNNMSPKEKLTPGLTVIIPGKGDGRVVARVKRAVSAKESVAAAQGAKPTVASAGNGEFITHVVRRGESLWSISEKYDVTVQELFRWNNLKKSRLMPGKRLKIKSRAEDGTASATDSSLAPHRKPATRVAKGKAKQPPRIAAQSAVRVKRKQRGG